jgi:peptidoglycan hydrolase CwlO-like protein
MNRSIKYLVGTLVFMLASPSFAGKGEGVQRRLQNQKKRIDMGVKKGKLTEQQAADLKQNIDKIEAQKNEALQDGKISKEEREKLKGELKQSSEQIRNLKNPKAPEESAPAAQ